MSSSVEFRAASASLPTAGEERWHDELPRVDELPLASLGTEVDGAESTVTDLRSCGLLGEGGMSQVWLASQRSLLRKVAVKTARDRDGSGAAIVREGVITGMLEHPSIPPIHGLSRDARGRPVLVMKHIEGVSWARVLDERDHPLRAESPLFAGVDPEVANIEVLTQVCNALELAHARGIIHRDIKPANVMLGRFGEVYLIDWGVAFNRAWHVEGETVDLCGTASYVAPEMVTGETPDERTDVYLLGATLHELLVGAPPHEGQTVSARLAQAFESAPHEYGPSVPTELAALCRRAMARRRDERPASVREFRRALRTHLSHRASIALCAETDRRASELFAAIAASAVNHESVAKLQNECRFGYQQALREWPENQRAREGLAAVLRALCEHEITVEDVRGARGLLGELGGDAALAERIDALEARLSAREALARKVRAADEAMDVRRAARERTLMLGTMVVFGLGVIVWRRLAPVDGLDPRARHVSLLVVWSMVTTVFASVTAIVWRRLSASTVNRRIVVLCGGMLLAVLAHRATGLALRPHPSVTMAGDLAIALVTALWMAWFVARSLVWMAVPCALGMAAVCAQPGRAGLLYNVSMLAFIATAAWQLRGGRRAMEES